MRMNTLALAIGHVYQSADVYASFGVTNAIISSPEAVAEHEQNMLKMDVPVRDGDDTFKLEIPEEEPSEEQPAEEEPEEEPEETPKEEPEENPEEEPEEEPEALPDTLPEAPKDLEEARQAIEEYSDGFDALRAQAVAAGLDPTVASAAEAEYDTDGKLSEKTYEALAKVGYTKNFIDSYIRGQEAVAEAFVSKVVEYAGGQAKFQAVIKHMGTSSPESVEALYEAVERKDLKAIRSIINLGVASRTKVVGKAPARNITSKTAPVSQARQAPAAVQPFANNQEMVKAMNDPRYRSDDAYRRSVEARVMA
jgi:hypothetical protein